MKEVIALVRPRNLAVTFQATAALGAELLCHQRVLGRGLQGGLRYMRPFVGGQEGEIPFLPKRMLVWIVPEESVRAVVTAVISANQSGAPGDGKVFVCSLNEVADEEALAAGSAVGILAARG